MKKIIQLIKTHWQEDFHLLFYCYFGIFLIVSIFYNYQVDFEDSVLDSYFGTIWGIIWYTVFYMFSYYAILIPKLLLTQQSAVLKSQEMWVKSFFFLLLIGLSAGFHYHQYLMNFFDHPSEKVFLHKILSQIKRLSLCLIPLWLFIRFYDKKAQWLYGLNPTGFKAKPYLIMLGIMVPLIGWASFQEDFLNSYPTFKFWRIDEIFGLSYWQLSLSYEILYLLDFFSVELLFRGALVVGLVQVLGKNVILPMVATYAFLHFGKPLGETIGSIFGGYILGVIALYSRNIFGGCLIHIGVAFLMELFALIQHSDKF